MNEQVKLKLSDSKGVFYIEINGKQAMMTFVFSGEDKIIIDHTRKLMKEIMVKGFGNKMVQEAVFLQRKRIKIVPLCPFAKHVLRKHHLIMMF